MLIWVNRHCFTPILCKQMASASKRRYFSAQRLREKGSGEIIYLQTLALSPETSYIQTGGRFKGFQNKTHAHVIS